MSASAPAPLSTPAAAAPAVGAAGRLPARLAWVLLPIVALTLHALRYGHIADDAYISFRYARNLADGLGLVYNAGEAVMGFSNPTWTLLLALGAALGLDPELVAPALGLCANAVLLVLLLRLDPRWSAATLLRVGLPVVCGSFALWTIAGLEGPLFGLALTAGLLAAHRHGPTAPARTFALVGLLPAVAVWTRPEGALFAGALAFGAALAGRSWTERLRTFGWLLLAPTLAWLALTGWTFALYGSFVPNTYFAKAQPMSLALLARGLRYALKFQSTYSFVPAALALAWLALGGWRIAGPGRLAALLLAAFFAFFVGIGGDALVLHRMWAWTLPWWALLGAEALQLATARGLPRPAGWAMVAVALVVVFAPSVAGKHVDYLQIDEKVVESGRQLGDALRTLSAETPSIAASAPIRLAANTIGALGDRSRLPLVDMLGLTDAAIAHSPGKAFATPAHESHNGKLVLDRLPDLIVFGVPYLRSAPVDAAHLAASAQYASDRDLLADPRLASDYHAGNLRVGDGLMPLWVRRAWWRAHPAVHRAFVSGRAKRAPAAGSSDEP